MKAKWLEIDSGLQDKDTCMIMGAVFKHTHIPCFSPKIKISQYWNVIKRRQDHVSFLCKLN